MDFLTYRRPDTEERSNTRPEVYPTSIDYALSRVGINTGEGNKYFLDVLADRAPTGKGFVFCDSETPSALESAITGRTRSLGRNLAKCRIGNFVVPTIGWQCDGPWWIAFENDEYAILAIETFRI